MIRTLSKLFLFVLTTSCAGLTPIPDVQTKNRLSEERLGQLETLVELMKNDRVNELVDRVLLPLKRPNPIPDLETKEQFISYYPILFDSSFKEKLTTATFNKLNTIDRYDGFGILNGDMWLYDDGRIMTINYNSPQELALQKKLHLETENKMHSSIADWKQNVLVCQTDKYLIRIDQMENNELRYISWNKPKKINEKPDLILLNGKQEYHGSSGGVTYSFNNGEWTYQIDRVTMAESDDRLGLFLRVFQYNKEKMTLKTEEIK